MAIAPIDSGFLQKDDPLAPPSDAMIHFRELIPRADHPRIAGIDKHTALSWCQSRREVPAPAWLIDRLDIRNIERPHKGFSADGQPDPSVHHYEADEGAPVEAAVRATNRLLELISEDEARELIKGDVVDDDEFRAWSNPELYVNPGELELGSPSCVELSIWVCRSRLTLEGGIRLEETTEEIRHAIHAVLQASLSPEGYAKSLGCMLTNHFLGELINGLSVLNRDSYNFRLFLPEASNTETGTGKGAGTRRPSLTKPWGWTFFGHHLCLAVCFVGKRMIIGPTFMGAEPDQIDQGPHAGLRLFQKEEMGSLRLMRELDEGLRAKATLSLGMTAKDGLADDRWNPFDER